MKNGRLVGTVDVSQVSGDDLLGMIIMGKQPERGVLPYGAGPVNRAPA